MCSSAKPARTRGSLYCPLRVALILQGVIKRTGVPGEGDSPPPASTRRAWLCLPAAAAHKLRDMAHQHCWPHGSAVDALSTNDRTWRCWYPPAVLTTIRSNAQWHLDRHDVLQRPLRRSLVLCHGKGATLLVQTGRGAPTLPWRPGCVRMVPRVGQPQPLASVAKYTDQATNWPRAASLQPPRRLSPLAAPRSRHVAMRSVRAHIAGWLRCRRNSF